MKESKALIEEVYPDTVLRDIPLHGKIVKVLNKLEEKEINKVIADQKKRRKEWKAWLVGYNG